VYAPYLLRIKNISGVAILEDFVFEIIEKNDLGQKLVMDNFSILD
jgi:hypothetical protein